MTIAGDRLGGSGFFDPAQVQVVVPAPGEGRGNWSGAASVIGVDGVFWFAWRERRPLEAGRGVAVVIARSTDGETVEPVARVGRELFGAESLERPALVALPASGWRLYVSCATTGSKHWWIDSLTAPTPQQLPSGVRAVALPGDTRTAVKDPVVWRDADEWRMFVCCHPLSEPGDEDRMTTRLATSADGLSWTDGGEMLCGTTGSWDARGTRITAALPGTVIDGMPELVLYDGRPDATSNWYETTGLARWDGTRYVTVPGEHLRSPHSDGALRYAAVMSLPGPTGSGRIEPGRTEFGPAQLGGPPRITPPITDGPKSSSLRWYAERAREDGAHDLVTWSSS